MLAIENALLPARLTWVDGRDDIGRDAFAQAMQSRDDGSVTALSLTFTVQAKSTRDSFEGEVPLDLEVRHLKLWFPLFGMGTPTLVVVWSRASNCVRLRTAESIVAELNRSKPKWREQGQVRVWFRDADTYERSDEAYGSLIRRLQQEDDKLGGISRPSGTIRSVVLTDLHFEDVATMTHITASRLGGEGEVTVYFGPGWERGDIASEDVYAPAVLANALFLFERLLIPLNGFSILLKAIGEEPLVKLIAGRRLTFFAQDSPLGILRYSRANAVSIATLRDHESQTGQWDVEARISRMVARTTDPTSVKELLTESLIHIPVDVGQRASAEVKHDLANANLRRMLGLSRNPEKETEAIWDRALLGRLIHLVTALRTADHVRADVVELETGLSRIASEKIYGEHGYDRSYASALVFDEVMRSTGVPDLAQLIGRLGVDQVLTMATGPAAQDFRDWFWATTTAAEGPCIQRDAFVRAFEEMVLPEASSTRLAKDFRMRFFGASGRGDFANAGFTAQRLPGFAMRGIRAVQTLKQQRFKHYKRRRKEIRRLLGKMPAGGSACPCGSRLRFRACCGRLA